MQLGNVDISRMNALDYEIYGGLGAVHAPMHVECATQYGPQ